MSDKTDVWMPLFIGDYLRDTNRLTTEQHGAYLLLIMDYWTNGAPPDEDDVLASITRLSTSAWKKARPAISRLFRISDGVWHHKRIEEELKNAAENSKKNIERAKKAAAKRWGNQSSGNAPSNAPSNQQELLDKCPSPSPSPSPSVTPEAIASVTTLTVGEAENENRLAPEASDLSDLARVCIGLKAMGYSDTNPHDAKLATLLELGLSPEEILAAGKTGSGQGKGFRWVLATAEGRRRDAANIKPLPPASTDNPSLGRLSQAGQQTYEAGLRWLESSELEQ